MDKAVQSWFNKYYGECLGANSPIYTIGTDADEQRIVDEYKYKFLKPMCYIATGTDQVPEDKSVLNRALTVIGSGPITDWIYMLNFWVNSGMYEYTGDVSAAYKQCVERTKKETFVSFVTIGKAYHDIAIHTVDRKMVDDLPFEVLFYPRDLKAHYKGRLLQDLCKKNPTIVTQSEAAFLSAAEARGFITTDDLMLETILWPYNKGTEERPLQIHALTLNKPPLAYFDLCKNMAPAQLELFPTKFLAVKNYAEMSPVSDDIKNFINIISTADVDLQEGAPQPAELNDQMVMDYLLENYGLQCASLSDLTVSTPGQFNNMIQVTPELLEGSVQELMDAMTDEDMIRTETLDSMIETFCKNNNVSQKCTIEQLIQVINYEVHPVPLSFVDQIAIYMSENNAPVTTTFDDVIKGVKHYDQSQEAIAYEWILKTPKIGDTLRQELQRAIMEDEQVDMPNAQELFMSELQKLGLPDELLSRAIVAVQTNSKIEMPKEAVDYEKAPDDLNDKGFRAGYILLRKTREKLSKDASFDTRTRYTHILYSFLRLLMSDPNDLEDVINALQKRVEQADEEVAAIISEAVDILRK